MEFRFALRDLTYSGLNQTVYFMFICTDLIKQRPMFLIYFLYTLSWYNGPINTGR